jgi:microsomal dipeptidase-like Zn-dependent dipeptidase
VSIGVAGVALACGVAQAKTVAPSSVYGFANGCFSVRGDATPFYFKATGLGTYMLQDAHGGLLSVGDGGAVDRRTTPGPAAEWAVQRAGVRRFALRATAGGRWLTVTADGTFGTADTAAPLHFTSASGCRPFPEAEVGAAGRPPKGRNRDGTVFGYADPHLHVTAELRAGGRVVHGESFDRFGIGAALGHDAEDHGPNGALDLTGNLLRTGLPVGTHKTDGWPTFTGWPTYDTYTHQQTYYVWLQRAWMSGLRLVTAQLIEDQPLCQIQPLRSHSCDETATIELEAQRLRALQDYVDAQSGGPGRGWFRLVFDPRQARQVIEQGKLAVVMGVEASDPFGCRKLLGQTPCDRAAVDRGIALYRQLGIRAMFIAHWVDNAFAGAAIEEGAKGAFIAAMQITQTGLPFATGPCPEAGQGSTCNGGGLTALGAYLVERLIDSHILIEVDHLSERARLTVLQMAEARRYPLVSSHTHTGGIWTHSDLERLYALGGFASARPDTAAKLARAILGFRDDVPAGRFLGVGLGTDTGGFAALPAPDRTAALRYPFRAVRGRIQFVRERTGQRVFDLGADGVAHYGLFPDLLASMRQQPGGEAATALLFRSAEAYLRTWERAVTGRAQ